MATKAGLAEAKANKADEFYTQLTDIEKEMVNYKEHFKGKTILCNCDDPRVSNFFKYFALNFNHLGIKKLISTCYKNQELDLFSQNDCEKAICVEYSGSDKDHIPTEEELDIKILKGDGDFRSQECIDLLKKADIVVTNPPFSLFREYIAQLIKYEKKFIVLGNQYAITYQEIFPLLAENKIWLGQSIHSGDREFGVPDSYPLRASGCRIDENGKKYIRVKGVRWFTNLDYKDRHEDLILVETYSQDKYPKYDNYDAIHIEKTSDIPCDYDDVMGVPITFLDKYNPSQFELIGYTSDVSIGEDNPLRLHPNSYYDGYVWKCGKNKEKNHRVSSWMPLLKTDKFKGTKCTKEGCPDLYQHFYRVLIRRLKDGE